MDGAGHEDVYPAATNTEVDIQDGVAQVLKMFKINMPVISQAQNTSARRAIFSDWFLAANATRHRNSRNTIRGVEVITVVYKAQ